MENRLFFPWYFGVTLVLLGAVLFVAGPSPVAGELERSKTGLGLFPAHTEPAPEFPPSSAPGIKVEAFYGQLPLYFIVNRGQVDRRVKLYARAGGQTLWFTREGACFTFAQPKAVREDSNGKGPLAGMRQPRVGNSKGAPPMVVRQIPLGMSKNSEIIPLEPQEARVNYFLGNDPRKWRTNIPTYRAVLYRDAYPGIDLKFYGHGRQLEYDVIVRPGADPRQVKFRYRGIRSLKLTPEGDLAIKLPDGSELTHRKPVIYQEIDDRRTARQGTFQILDRTTFGFQVADYDRQYALVIDPVLAFATYLGGSAEDRGQAIAVDKDGNICVTGYTYSDNFPLANAYDAGWNATEVFVTKYRPSGSAMIFSTFFGGPSADWGYGVAVDGDCNIYVTGATITTIGFPLVDAFQPLFGNGSYEIDTTDAFVAKFDKTGSTLLYSSYLGGSKNDTGQAIAVDRSGCAYVTGDTDSTDFPTTPTAKQSTDPPPQTITSGMDAFVTKVSAEGTYKVYSTYLGGNLADQGIGIALDQSGPDPLACVAGRTVSTAATFPLKNAKQPTRGSATYDGFVAKVNADGTDWVFCTFLGGDSYDEAHGVAVGSAGHVCVSGWTGSSNFPTTPGVYQPAKKGSYDAFVTKYLPDGSDYVFSTYLGGTGLEGTSSNIGFCFRIAVDAADRIYVTGFTVSSDFPLKNELYPFKAASEIFLTKFTPDGSALVYSTYLGGNLSEYPQGIAVDRAGNVYLTGHTNSTADFPLKNPLQASLAGGSRDAFVIKVTNPPSNAAVYMLLLD